MTDINEFTAFERVVREGTFTAAAAALQIPNSTLSDRIQKLEARLGAQLLERTTRSMTVTDAGAAFYAKCQEIVGLIAEAELAVHSHRLQPQGTLRVTAPTLLGRYCLGPVVAQIITTYPELNVELFLANQRVHLLDEGLDLAIRTGPLNSSSMRVRGLGNVDVICVAAPDFLEDRDIESAEDLKQFRCIGLNRNETWRFPDGTSHRFAPQLIINDMEMVRDAAIKGLGIARTPRFVVQDALNASELVVVGEDSLTLSTPLFAIYPGRKFVAPRVRAFLDILVEALQNSPL